MRSFLIFTGMLASLLMYLVVARRGRSAKSTNPDDFFLARSSVNASQFGAAQTAYALQMATVYPFFMFSYNGMWWAAALNIIFYAVGIAIFYALLPKFRSSAVDILGKSRTMHSAIANLHGVPRLRQFTAIMSVIAFSGLCVFEVTWGARAFKILFNGSDTLYYLCIAIITLYLVLYVWVGGQRAAIRADQYQLFLSYAGLHALTAWIIWQPEVSLQHIDFQLIIPVILASGALMLLIRFKALKDASAPSFLRYLNIFTIISLILLLLALLARPRNLIPQIDIGVLRKAFATDQFFLIAVSLSSLPLLFQFVDMTNWQRMASLKTEPARFLSDARKGLLQYVVESPLSWMLPVLIGECASQFLTVKDGADPWDSLLIVVLHVPTVFGALLALFVFTGIVAIFLSTADGLLTAVGYAFAYDVSRATRAALDRRQGRSVAEMSKEECEFTIRAGRHALMLTTACVTVLFIAVDTISTNYGKQLVGIFLSFYSPLISMAPSLLVPAVMGRTASPIFVVLSLTLGMFIGLAFGIYSVIDPDKWGGASGWLASPSSLFVSWLFYGIGIPFGRRIRD